MTDTQELQQLEYTGNVRELGAVELSKAGKEKKRKVVVSDKPEYAGKTFRCWADTPEWASLEAAAQTGEDVTIGYTPTPVEWQDKKWTENSIDWVALGQGQGNNWGTPAAAAEEPAGWDEAPAPVAAPVAAAPPPTKRDDKDAIITASAITKSLIEGKYLTKANLDSGDFEVLVRQLVALVHKVAGS